MFSVILTTIYAVCTSKGLAGVAIIRVSGPKTYFITKQLIKNNFKSRYANLFNIFINQNYFLDCGIILFFKKPCSYTGEDIVEFHVHGGFLILQKLTKVLFRFGAKLAGPGEFTKRAYLNKKLDLLKLKLIFYSIYSYKTSYSTFQENIFDKQISLVVFRIIKQLKQIYFILEKNIYFFDDNTQIKDFQNWKIELNNIKKIFLKITVICNDKQEDNNFGHKLLIMGWPNVGKSSLFNYFNKQEQAIVSSVEGTTRDLLQHNFLYKNKKVIIFDTVGLRFYDNYVELEGLKKSLDLIKNNGNIILCFDICNSFLLNIPEMLWPIYFLTKQTFYYIFNKIDELPNDVSYLNYRFFFFISARFEFGINNLIENIFSKYFDIFFNSFCFQDFIFYLSRAINSLDHSFFDLVLRDIKKSFQLLEQMFRIKEYNVAISILNSLCVGK